METIYGLPTYVSSTSDNTTSKSTILFICDAFGLKLVNNKLLADRYAADTGCRVLAPDFLAGSAMSVKAMDYMDTIFKPVTWTNLFGQVQRIYGVLGAMYHFVPFIVRSGPATGAQPSLKYARAIKADLQPGGKLGVAGFCWGGYGSTFLSAQPSVEGGKEPLIDAQFCAHPSGISQQMVLDALTTFKTPYSMAIGDEDFVFNEKTVLSTQAEAREKVGHESENNYEIKIYKGCKHGFAMRASPGNKVESDAAEEAAKQAVAWFDKYLN